MLKAAVFAEREAIAAAALDGALNPALSPASRASHALKLIHEVDPPLAVTLDTPLPTNPEGVEQLSLKELQALAEQVL